MPATTVYRCDKNANAAEGVDGQVCRREVLTDEVLAEGGVTLILHLKGKHEGNVGDIAIELTFCGAKHMSYWLRNAVKRGLRNPEEVRAEAGEADWDTQVDAVAEEAAA